MTPVQMSEADIQLMQLFAAWRGDIESVPFPDTVSTAEGEL